VLQAADSRIPFEGTRFRGCPKGELLSSSDTFIFFKFFDRLNVWAKNSVSEKTGTRHSPGHFGLGAALLV
jgi:hypothetical protein